MGFSEKNRVVVIGGNDAGLSAAGRASRINPGLEVVVIEKTQHLSYASCGLPRYLSGRLPAAAVSGADAADLEKKHGYIVRLSHRVHHIDLIRHRVEMVDLSSGRDSSLHYSKLIVATGARPVAPDFFKERGKNIFCMRNFEDAEHLDAFIRDAAPRRALVLGAGPLGLEMAEALVRRGLNVVLVEKSTVILPGFAEVISQTIREVVRASGIDLHLGCEIEGGQSVGNQLATVTLRPELSTVNLDLVFVAAGIHPETELMQASGIPLGSSGAVAINRRQETARSDVYAAGDCSESYHRVLKKFVWSPFAGSASKSGHIAGSNAAGQHAASTGVLGTMMINAFDLEFGRTGLTRTEAEANGLDAFETVIVHDAKAIYMNDNVSIIVVLIVERKTGAVLGAQVCGARDAGLRLNIAAVAVHRQMNVAELAGIDLGYAPEIVNMWDPIQIAARVAQRQLRKR